MTYLRRVGIQIDLELHDPPHPTEEVRLEIDTMAGDDNRGITTVTYITEYVGDAESSDGSPLYTVVRETFLGPEDGLNRNDGFTFLSHDSVIGVDLYAAQQAVKYGI